MRFVSVALLMAVTLFACQKSDSADDAPTAAALQTTLAEQYFQKSSTLEVQVWYEQAAAPYTKEKIIDRDFWNVLRQNLIAIMQYRSTPPTITVPSTLAQMNLLSITSQENWTSDQIIALAAQHQVGTAADGTSRFYVYFFNGYFNKGAGSDKGILGVSLGGTNILAMFKPVIQSTATGAAEIVPKFVEQSTMVHELGHALGFVNNGVPMVVDYQDKEHGAHSNNADDVMYWLNEGAADLQKFVLKYTDSQSVVMWGPQVLDDAKAFSK